MRKNFILSQCIPKLWDRDFPKCSLPLWQMSRLSVMKPRTLLESRLSEGQLAEEERVDGVRGGCNIHAGHMSKHIEAKRTAGGVWNTIHWQSFKNHNTVSLQGNIYLYLESALLKKMNVHLLRRNTTGAAGTGEGEELLLPIQDPGAITQLG